MMDTNTKNTATLRKAPPKRTLSNPFYRKAVPTRQQEDNSDHGRRLVKHHPSYASFSSTLNPEDKQQQQQQQLERHLTLLDLIAIGVGGTVGSGLFVLTGLVARQYAGPATTLSWCLSGVTACLSGCCYAECAARIPLAGSAYSFTYVALGEVFAVVAAACLSLEYIVASAAVARAWGDKAAAYLGATFAPTDGAWLSMLLPKNDAAHSTCNPLAFGIAATCVGLLLCGVKESKRVTNVFTSLKVSLVLFMVLTAFWYTKPVNWIPFCPYGMSGVTRGATSTFFGYLGYDQVCCLAGEVQNAKRNLPRAVLGVLAGCAALYVLAALALTGMVPHEQISTVAGFPDGFRTAGAPAVIAQLTALGEIVTMPIVILVTVMVQPRLQYALAVDGLLPPVFQSMDRQGNLFFGTATAGGLFVLISTFVPFENLNDMISCAVLSALRLTDTSVIMLWHEPAHDPDSPLTCYLIMTFHAAALAFGLALTHMTDSVVLPCTCTVIMVGSCCAIYYYCPRTAHFGGQLKHYYHEEDLLRDDDYFETPFVPFLPCLAIAINWWLIAQLALTGIALLLGFVGWVILYYLLYAQYHALGGTTAVSLDEKNGQVIELLASDDNSHADANANERIGLVGNVEL